MNFEAIDFIQKIDKQLILSKRRSLIQQRQIFARHHGMKNLGDFAWALMIISIRIPKALRPIKIRQWQSVVARLHNTELRENVA